MNLQAEMEFESIKPPPAVEGHPQKESTTTNVWNDDSKTITRNSKNKLDKNHSAAQKALELGFWQRVKPVEMERWDAIDNLTCVIRDDTTLSKTGNVGFHP
jgi:hypothetical protein